MRVKFGIRPHFLTKVLQDVGTGGMTNCYYVISNAVLTVYT